MLTLYDILQVPGIVLNELHVASHLIQTSGIRTIIIPFYNKETDVRKVSNVTWISSLGNGALGLRSSSLLTPESMYLTTPTLTSQGHPCP